MQLTLSKKQNTLGQLVTSAAQKYTECIKDPAMVPGKMDFLEQKTTNHRYAEKNETR